MPTSTIRPGLEFCVSQKVLDQVLRRLMWCGGLVGLGEVVASGPEDGDPTHCVRLRTPITLAGVPVGETLCFRLYISGLRNEAVHFEFVASEHQGEHSLLDREDLAELNLALFYLQHNRQPMLELPIVDELLGNVGRYLLKATPSGHLLFGAKIVGGFSEEGFLAQYEGAIPSNQRSSTRLWVSAQQEWLLERVVAFYNEHAAGHEGPLTRHTLSAEDIEFLPSALKVSVPLTFAMDCTAIGHVNIDLRVAVRADLSVARREQGSALDALVTATPRFADDGEAAQAVVCGLLDGLFSMDVKLNAVVLLPLLLPLAPFAVPFANDILGKLARGEVSLANAIAPGIQIFHEGPWGELRYRLRVTPVAMLQSLGGLLWPLRFAEIDLNRDGHVIVRLDQDADAAQEGAQEAQAQGAPSLAGNACLVIETLGGETSATTEMALGTEGPGLCAICGVRVVNDEHRAFRVSQPGLLAGMGGDALSGFGTRVVSVQNALPVTVQLGPGFVKRVLVGSGEIKRWVEVPWQPGPGARFDAGLEVAYRVFDGAGFHERTAVFPLEGRVTSGVDLYEPDIHIERYVDFYAAEDMFQASEPWRADPDLWLDPAVGTQELLEVQAVDRNVVGLRVDGPEGAVLGEAEGGRSWLRLLSSAESAYSIVPSAPPGVSETHYRVRRQVLEELVSLDLEADIQAFAYSHRLLGVGHGNQLRFFDLSDPVRPSLVGNVELTEPVKFVQAQQLDGTNQWSVSDGRELRLLSVSAGGQVTVRSSIGARPGGGLGAVTRLWGMATLGAERTAALERRLDQGAVAVTAGDKSESSLFVAGWLLQLRGGKLQAIATDRDMEADPLDAKGATSLVALGGGHVALLGAPGTAQVLRVDRAGGPLACARYHRGAPFGRFVFHGELAFARSGSRLQVFKRVTREVDRGAIGRLVRTHAGQLGRSPLRPLPERTEGARFLVNTAQRQVHDLKFEQPQCQVDRILSAGHGARVTPDTLGQAHAEGFVDCGHCMRSAID